VKNAEEYLDGQDFLVVGGDHVTDVNLLELFRAHQKLKPAVSIGLISIDDPAEYGIADIDASYRIRRFKEKPAPGEIFSNLASTGMYVCSPEILSLIPDGKKFDFAKDLFPLLMSRGKIIRGWLARGNWTDVGNPASLRQAGRWKLDEIPSTTISGEVSIRGGHILGPVLLGDQISIGKNSQVIGPVAIGTGQPSGMTSSSVLYEHRRPLRRQVAGQDLLVIDLRQGDHRKEYHGIGEHHRQQNSHRRGLLPRERHRDRAAGMYRERLCHSLEDTDLAGSCNPRGDGSHGACPERGLRAPV